MLLYFWLFFRFWFFLYLTRLCGGLGRLFSLLSIYFLEWITGLPDPIKNIISGCLKRTGITQGTERLNILTVSIQASIKPNKIILGELCELHCVH